MTVRLTTTAAERLSPATLGHAATGSTQHGAEAARAQRATAAAAKPAQAQAAPVGIQRPRAPGATAVFTARQSHLNEQVTGVQRALAFVETASGHLKTLKASLAGKLGAGAAKGDPATDLARFQSTWSQRAVATGGVLDAQLDVRPAGDAARTFRLRAIDTERWSAAGSEALTFYPAGLGKQTVTATFGDAPMDAAALARRLDNALATVGIRAGVDAEGEITLTVAETRWPTVRDRLMLQGGGKRFPGGRPSRAQADAAPEAVDPARWNVADRTGQRIALREVVRALDGLTRAERALNARLDAARGTLKEGLGASAGKHAIGAAQSVSTALDQPASFSVMKAVTSSLGGLSRARVETLLNV